MVESEVGISGVSVARHCRVAGSLLQVWQGPEDPLERPALVVSFVVFDMVATGPVYKALDEDGSGAIQRFEWESVLDKAKAKRFACGFSSRLPQRA